MSQQKETRKENEAQQAASVHDADLMGRFMRLCDVMLIAGLIDLCHHGLEEVKAQLQAHRKHGVITVYGDLESVSGPRGNATQSITSCSVIFTPTKDDLEVPRPEKSPINATPPCFPALSLVFPLHREAAAILQSTPDTLVRPLHALQNVMRSTISEIVDVVSKTPRPLYFPEFLEFFDPFESGKCHLCWAHAVHGARGSEAASRLVVFRDNILPIDTSSRGSAHCCPNR